MARNFVEKLNKMFPRGSFVTIFFDTRKCICKLDVIFWSDEFSPHYQAKPIYGINACQKPNSYDTTYGISLDTNGCGIRLATDDEIALLNSVMDKGKLNLNYLVKISHKTDCNNVNEVLCCKNIIVAKQVLNKIVEKICAIEAITNLDKSDANYDFSLTDTSFHYNDNFIFNEWDIELEEVKMMTDENNLDLWFL